MSPLAKRSAPVAKSEGDSPEMASASVVLSEQPGAPTRSPGRQFRAPRREQSRESIPKMVAHRLLLGLLTLVLVSILVFAATEVLPGNAARAVLGQGATPQRLHDLEVQLHLNAPVPLQFWRWFRGVATGHFGSSLANGDGVWTLVRPRLVNSAVLIGLSGLIGTVLGIIAGITAAARRDGWFDTVVSTASLALSAVPEFVIALALIILFSTVVLHLFPGVSVFPPGSPPWDNVRALVLPVLTLVIVIFPYIFRMTRVTMIEALNSDHAEMAELKGLSHRRRLFVHALPNTIPAIVQVTALNFVYLAGGIVVVEYVFNYDGIGQGLVQAVADRDIPVIQFMVLALTAFYVLVNIAADVGAILTSPRRRFPRSG